MGDNEIFKDLHDILKQLSIELKYGRGYFEGGMVRYKEQSVLYLNRAHSIEKHIEIISKELKQFDLGRIEINPEIQGYLERPVEN